MQLLANICLTTDSRSVEGDLDAALEKQTMKQAQEGFLW